MKILLTVHQFLPKYASGTEVLTYETARRLIELGHDARVLTAEPTDYETALQGGVMVDHYKEITVYRVNHHLGVTPNPVRYEYANRFIYEKVSDIIQEFEPDIFHIMHASRLSAAIIDAAKEKHIPVVLTATDFWFVCPLSQLRLLDNSPCIGPSINSTNCLRCYVSKTQPQSVIESFNKIPSPFLCLINGFAKFSFAEKWEKGKMARALVRRKGYMHRQLDKIDQVIAPTDLMCKILEKNGVSKAKISKLHYGINLDYTTEEIEPKRYNGKIKFGFIGTIYEHKGVHILIKAFRKLREKYDNVELKIYGDLSHFPDYVNELKELAANDSKISFLGTFPNNEIGNIFREIDILIVPSIWYENTPLVIYSAFSTKTPVIATNLGGMTEVVSHSHNGFIFEKENVPDLKNQMERFLLDESLLETLSKNAPIVKSIRENVSELVTVYDSLLNKV